MKFPISCKGKILLTSSLRQTLKAKAHSLKPVVMIGQHGITDNVLASVDEALTAHELIKVRLPVSGKDEQLARITTLAENTKSEIIGKIGRVLILYRLRPSVDTSQD